MTCRYPLLFGLVFALAPDVRAQVNGHWKLDEGNGEIARDSLAGIGDGKIKNASWTQVDKGKVLIFKDYSAADKPDVNKETNVVIPHKNGLDPVTSLEVAADIFIDKDFTPQFSAGLVEKGMGFGCAFRLLLVPVNRGKIFQLKGTVGHGHKVLEGNTELQSNKWYAVRMVYADKKLSFYVDGKEDASMEVPTQDAAKEKVAAKEKDAAKEKIAANKDDIVIGTRFSGHIRDVKITAK